MLPRFSRFNRRVLAIAALSGVLFGCSRHPFSGDFVADNRPSGMVFLSTMQAGTAVNGFLMNVVPDGRGSTKSQTETVDGTSDGDTVSLHAKALLGLVNVTLSGRSEGRRFVLSTSSSSGQIMSLTFSRSTQESFNARLAEWQKVLLAQFQQEETARVAADARARAEQDEAAAREALVQRAQGAGVAFIASIRRLGDAVTALDRVTFDGEDRQAARWWMNLQRRAQQIRGAAARGTTVCWVLKNELTFLKNDADTGKQVKRSVADHARQLEDLIARVEHDVTENGQLEAGFSAAARADPTRSIPDNIVAVVPEKAKSARTAATEAIARARTQSSAASESAAEHDRNGEALVEELRDVVASASCRER